MRVVTAFCAVIICAGATPLAALEQMNLILPNDRSMPMGETGSIEGSAVVARTTGASAAWYNPAGVAGQASSEVMGSASIYEYSHVGVDSAFGNDSRKTVSVVPGAAGICEPLPEMFGGDGQWGVGFVVATPVYWRTSVAQQEAAKAGGETISVANTYDASYEEYLPTISLGRAFGEHRWGFSGAAVVHEISVSNAYSSVALPSGVLVSNSTQYHGRTVLLRLGAGWQWQRDEVVVGATVTAPGIRIWQSGDRTDTQLASNPLTNTVSFISGSTSDYHLDLDAPATATAAIARGGENWSLEVDATFQLGSSPRNVFPAFQRQRTTVSGGVTTIGTDTVAPVTSNRHAVLNGAVGFAHRVTDTWWAHAGFLSDRTPIADSQLFSRVDLWTAVAGLSVRGEHSLMTAGLASTWNTSGTSSSVDLPTGNTVESELSIRIWRLIVGTSYRF